MNKTILGVLAGMGPRSTSPFIESIIESCSELYGAKDDIDFPPISIFSLPTPFYPNIPLEHEKMLSCLKEGIDAITRSGATILAVPCNVAHLYYDQMCQFSKIPILNIIEETTHRLPNKNNILFIMGTDFTIKNHLYNDKVLKKQKTIYWNREIQSMVNELIIQTKKDGVSQKAINLWHSIEKDLIDNDVKEVIIACTDLSFCSHYKKEGITYYDSSKILAQSLVQHFINHKDIPSK